MHCVNLGGSSLGQQQLLAGIGGAVGGQFGSKVGATVFGFFQQGDRGIRSVGQLIAFNGAPKDIAGVLILN